MELEKERKNTAPVPTIFVKEKFNDMKKAISVFLDEADEYISDLEKVHVGLLVLRSDIDAAFFVAVNKAMRWKWMVAEIDSRIKPAAAA